MPTGSRIPGFYNLAPEARRRALVAVCGLTGADLASLDAESLSLSSADLMIENVVGTFALPFGVGVNFRINDHDVLVPMVVEEPSVVAAVSNMARLVRGGGGFTASADDSVMIGQIQVVGLDDADAAAERLRAEVDSLAPLAHGIHPRLEERGGGLRGFEVRRVTYDEPGEVREEMVVLHFFLDCVDAMGANMVNTVAERLAPAVEAITGGEVRLRILSNLASRRLARASCVLPAALLEKEELSGDVVALGIASAWRFAYADPWRAATHNKGIMNGIDAVALATGNDWRAIEAGAHAWAARDGQYRSLSVWKVDKTGALRGSLELPIQVGTVGGPIRNHAGMAAAHKLLGSPRARELGMVMAAVGLAQNLGALRALATEGIQKGHMRMHARNVAVQAGAAPAEVPRVVAALAAVEDWSVEHARVALLQLRAADGSADTSAGAAGTPEPDERGPV
jgi:hydroxymethylglutaryl-CoA reductase